MRQGEQWPASRDRGFVPGAGAEASFGSSVACPIGRSPRAAASCSTFADTVLARIRKRPPRHQWPTLMEPDAVKKARLRRAVCELKRIKMAGAALPPDAAAWLDRTIGSSTDLATMTVDSGFPEGVAVSSISPDPDDRYDALQGVTRLRTLETALAGNGRIRGDHGDRANDWLRQAGKTFLLLDDLESVDTGGDEFLHVWSRFLSVHASEGMAVGDQASSHAAEAGRLLRLLAGLSDNSLAVAIDGVSEWLYTYKEQAIESCTGVQLWSRAWPIAVRATDEIDCSIPVNPNLMGL